VAEVNYSDERQFKRTFQSIQKAQKEIDFFNKKISRNDPFSPKAIRESYKEINRWNKFEDRRLKLLSQNERIMRDLAKIDKSYVSELKKEGEVSEKGIRAQAALNRLRPELRSRRGWNSLLKSRMNEGRASADMLATGMQGQGTISTRERGLSSRLTNAGISAAIAAAIRNVTAGWGAAKAEQRYAEIAGAGELGGVKVDPVKGPYKFVGHRDYYLRTANRKRLTDWTSPEAKLLRSQGLTAANPMETAARLRSSGSAHVGPWEAITEGIVGSVMHAQGRMDESQMLGYKTIARRGGTDTQASNLVSIAAQAAKLGLTGARPGEYLDTMTSLMEAAQQTAANTDPKKFEESIWKINATGSPSLQGALGGQMAQSIQAGLLKPGGGPAGNLLVLRAMGFGSGKSLTEATMAAEEGLTPENLDRVREMFKGVKNRDYALWAFKSMFGTSLSRAKELLYGDPEKAITGSAPQIAEFDSTSWLTRQQKISLESSDVAKGAADARTLGSGILGPLQGAVIRLLGAAGALTSSVSMLSDAIKTQSTGPPL
jgi:hypothetical protein